jgi:DNA invertase Pin-like site-specific DNA recombinase
MEEQTKATIYLRTSTEEQNPLNQLEACKRLAEKLNLNYDIVQEQQSAFKDINRERFESIREAIKKRETSSLIIWDLDRLYRNRKKLIEFFAFCKIYSCKIYSVRQEWLESLNKIQEPFNEMMFDLMLQIMGWLAEEESLKKSERVKNAVRKEEGNKTKSYKGNVWGRKAINSQRLVKLVKELKEKGLSIREIRKHPEVYYYDKNKNQKKPSIAFIHNLLKEYSSV